MNLSSLMISFLTFVFVVYGMSLFYIQTAAVYSLQSDSLTEFQQEFYKYDFIIAKMNSIEAQLKAIRADNILSWGNMITAVLGMVSIMLDMPVALLNITSGAVGFSFFLIPSWATQFISGIILTIIIFKGIEVITSARDT